MGYITISLSSILVSGLSDKPQSMYHLEILTGETWIPLSTYYAVHIVMDVVNGVYNDHNDDTELLHKA